MTRAAMVPKAVFSCDDCPHREQVAGVVHRVTVCIGGESGRGRVVPTGDVGIPEWCPYLVGEYKNERDGE